MNVEEVLSLQSKLKIDLKILEDAGHINPNSGFGKFDYALDWIDN
jgi:predicted alpha/beta hydrolase family esterase